MSAQNQPKPQQLIPEQRQLEIIQEQQSSQPKQANQYLKNLLSRHMKQGQKAQNLMGVTQGYLSEQIMKGKYEIKSREWSLQRQKNRQARSETETKLMKKQLMEQLQQVQKVLNEQAQPKQSRVISEQQRIQFLKRLQKEKKQLAKKKELLAKNEAEQELQQIRKETEVKERNQQEKKLKKRQEVQERIKQLQQNRKKKQEQFKSQANLYKQKLKQKTMMDRIQQKFTQIQNETLQQRKQRLAQIRALHKPIDRKQLDAHSQKYQQLQAQRQVAGLQKPTIQSTASFYKSIFYKKAKEEQQYSTTKKQQEEELAKLKQARDRLKKFSEHIKQAYKPTIDQSKVEQIRFRSVNLKSRALSSQKVKMNESPKRIGLRYLEYSKTQADHQKLLGGNTEEDEKDDKQDKKKIDYLSELKELHKNRTAESAHSLIQKLEKDSVNRQQKTKKLLEFADKLQKKAKQKQVLSKISGNQDDNLDSLYLEAIHAKLHLLQDI